MSDLRADRPLAGRTALVTGASRGFGRAVAVALGGAGAHVVACARTTGGLEETDDAVRAAGGTATLIPIDLAKPEQVDALGTALTQRFGRLDLFVANAATLGAFGPIAYSETKSWAKVMELNLNANYRLVRALDPLLRAAPAGRAVFVTDRNGREATTYWSAYAVSKAALDTLAKLWAGETAKTGLRVALFDPGPMATALRAAGFPGEPQDAQPPPAIAASRLIARVVEDQVEAGSAVLWT
jgi:NAD(P)-dependent dehydrogenase (short-subunit alcohol dehydrogenase family)